MELFTWPPYAFECVLLFSAFALYYYIISPFTYWKRRGVAQIEVKHPIVGNMLVGLTSSIYDYLQLGYREFPNERFVGRYEMWKPSLLVRDPDLIDTILIKDFSYFVNRSRVSDPKGFAAKHLLNLTNDHWKSVRSKLNPTFSSGKLKGMHPQLISCGESLIKYLKNYENGSAFEMRGVMQRFTMDVIASCAFGLNTDTINDPDSEFRKMGMAFSKPSFVTKVQLMLNIRAIASKLKLERFLSNTRKDAEYFVGVVNQTLKQRKADNVVRQDFLHLMNELVEKDLETSDPFKFDEKTLVSNALVFFLAGFETTAGTVSFALHELAVNQDVQERVYQEITQVLSKHDGLFDYSAVQEMVYLDYLVSETLRKYPPVASLSRMNQKDYTIPGTDVVVPAGTNVHIPVFSLHYDPQYFPNPHRFNPERFDKNLNQIRKGTYVPFGDGPRMCIAARFARIESKLCLAMMVHKYKILKCSKTQEPLKFNKKAFLLAPERGIWVSIQCR